MGTDQRVLQPLGTHPAHLSCRLTSGSPLQGRFDFYLPRPVPGSASNCCHKRWEATADAMPSYSTDLQHLLRPVDRGETEAWRRDAPPPPPRVTRFLRWETPSHLGRRSDAQVLSAGSGEVQSGGLEAQCPPVTSLLISLRAAPTPKGCLLGRLRPREGWRPVPGDTAPCLFSTWRGVGHWQLQV